MAKEALLQCVGWVNVCQHAELRSQQRVNLVASAAPAAHGRGSCMSPNFGQAPSGNKPGAVALRLWTSRSSCLPDNSAGVKITIANRLVHDLSLSSGAAVR